MKTFYKDAGSTLDFQRKWDKWLGTDTITLFTASAAAGVTITSTTNTDTTTTAWISGGTEGQSYEIRYTILTVGGRTDIRSFILSIVRQ